jgi:hypothetical protein
VQTYTGGQTIAANNLSTTQGATVTLYAIWKINQYTITYSANGGSGTVAAQTGNYSSTVTLRNNGFTRTAYHQDGWRIDGANGGWIAASATYTIPAYNPVMYASWENNTYTIAYNKNGGSGTNTTQAVTCNGNVTLKAATIFTSTGQTNLGWNTSSTATQATYAGSATVTANNISTTNGATVTFYAIWKNNTITVTYKKNGGTGTDTSHSATCNNNVTLNATSIYSRTGYTALGWNTSSTATTALYGSEATIATNSLSTTDGATATLYAI